MQQGISPDPYRLGLFNFAQTFLIKQFTLNKTERLKKRKDIERLFKEGRSFSLYPLRVYYLAGGTGALPNMEEAVLQFGVSVSKRYFKKAVHRNRIKRLIREAYRTQKGPLQQRVKEEQGACLKLFVIYTGKELPDYYLMQTRVAAALERLEKETLKRPS